MNGKAKVFAIALCMAAILVLACVPVAFAGHPQKAEGTWTWVNTSFNAWYVDDDMVNQYAVGDEEGTWVGTFSGRSHDDFAGVIPSDQSIGGALTSVFHGRVGHARGTMVMFITWWAPITSLFMDGTWEIVYASGGLEHLRGSGTWVSLVDAKDTPLSAADYAGKLWRD